MVQRIGGMRRNTRFKMRKGPSRQGKVKIRDFLQSFKEGDRVVLKAEPAYQKGMYHPRFHGKRAVVVGKKGDCYECQFKDIDKQKIVIVHPVHLQKA
ncbi:50S ribosomal protein L21e [Candidatus Woesearchaeota archaeon]|nr:50S ribosomal protein L21e [Candidatus Woesearchaeota archaeon]